MIKKVLTTFLTLSAVAVATWYLLPYVKDTEYVLPKFFIVESGSMEPAIKTGSVVVSVPQKFYQINDIVTFRYGNKGNQPVTHRIEVRKFDASGAAIYQTSGDANKAFDPLEITDDNIIGKVVISVPYLGYVANFAKTLKGFIFLIIIPATIIIYEELKNVWREVGVKLGKKKLQTEESQIEVQKAAVVLPFIGVLFLTSSISSSFFMDRESVFGNFIKGQIPVTPPITSSTNDAHFGDVVINEINWAGSRISSADEWLELKNMTSTEIDLSGWIILGAGSGGDLVITSGVIPSNGFFLIANYSKTGSQVNVDPDLVTTSVQLNNSNVQLVLKTKLGTVVDVADDGVGVPFAGSNTDPKKSMERKSPPGDGTQVTNWQNATIHINMDGNGVDDEFGTPKSENSI